jgi:hypothetical protein
MGLHLDLAVHLVQRLATREPQHDVRLPPGRPSELLGCSASASDDLLVSTEDLPIMQCPRKPGAVEECILLRSSPQRGGSSELTVQARRRAVANWMRQAFEYRIAALTIVKDALNYARREIQRQLIKGAGDPVAFAAKGPPEGYPATRLDSQMNRRIQQHVGRRTPRATYWSEENRSNVFPEDGDVFAWCDPLDGTTNAFTVFGGYAVVLFYEVYRDQGFEHLAGAIASSSGEIVSWQKFGGSGEVWIDWPSDFVWPSLEGGPAHESQSESVIWAREVDVTDPVPKGVEIGQLRSGAGDIGAEVPIQAGYKRRFASVATTVARRERLFKDFDLHSADSSSRKDRLWLSTCAGNPLIAPLLLGDLGAIIEVESVRLHDAAYLIPLLLAGGKVVNPDESELPVYRAFFEPNPEARTIGPFVAAASGEAIRELMTRRRSRASR